VTESERKRKLNACTVSSPRCGPRQQVAGGNKIVEQQGEAGDGELGLCVVNAARAREGRWWLVDGKGIQRGAMGFIGSPKSQETGFGT
jgi:hypothetical protein